MASAATVVDDDAPTTTSTDSTERRRVKRLTGWASNVWGRIISPQPSPPPRPDSDDDDNGGGGGGDGDDVSLSASSTGRRLTTIWSRASHFISKSMSALDDSTTITTTTTTTTTTTATSSSSSLAPSATATTAATDDGNDPARWYRHTKFPHTFVEARAPPSRRCMPSPRLSSSRSTRTLWLMQMLLRSMKSDGGDDENDDGDAADVRRMLTGNLVCGREFWRQDGVKIVGFSIKMTHCEHVCRLLEALRVTVQFTPENTDTIYRTLVSTVNELITIQNTMSFSIACVDESEESVVVRTRTPPPTPFGPLDTPPPELTSTSDLHPSPSPSPSPSPPPPSSSSASSSALSTFASKRGALVDALYNVAKGAKRFAHKYALPNRLQRQENEAYIDVCCRALQYHVVLADLAHIYTTKPELVALIQQVIDFYRVCVCAFILDDASSFFAQYQRNVVPSIENIFYNNGSSSSQ